MEVRKGRRKEGGKKGRKELNSISDTRICNVKKYIFQFQNKNRNKTNYSPHVRG